MGLLKINLMGNRGASAKGGGKGRRPAHLFLTVTAAILMFSMSFVFGRMTRSMTLPLADISFENIPILGAVSHLILSPDRKLKGEDTDRVNILMMGMGGEGHDGAYLTDTVILASLRPSDGKVAMLSIPRDLYVPIPDDGWRKINALNALGETQEHGRGGEYARTMMEGLFGTDIPYYVRVDFNGFKEMVDAVSGVDVYVERDFSDYTYPTYDFGVQTIKFKKGWQHMDGETALKYSRSRHGNNGEGTDFARSKRQQKVMMALKDKITSGQLLRNPASITSLMAALNRNVSTNLSIGDILRLTKYARGLDPKNIVHQVLDNSSDSPLVEKTINGAYALVPRNDDWSMIRKAVANVYEEGTPAVESEVIPPKPSETTSGTTGNTEKVTEASVEVRNASGAPGRSKEIAGLITKAGLQVTRITSIGPNTQKKTAIYDLTRGTKANELKALTKALGSPRVARGLPSGAQKPDGVDFLVVIGED